uniref:Uncharacterized protein n=1 Tax=Oryza meridionalis TaxID=40149 RepID=A0A0E0CAA7_9ORYZ
MAMNPASTKKYAAQLQDIHISCLESVRVAVAVDRNAEPPHVSQARKGLLAMVGERERLEQRVPHEDALHRRLVEHLACGRELAERRVGVDEAGGEERVGAEDGVRLEPPVHGRGERRVPGPRGGEEDRLVRCVGAGRPWRSAAARARRPLAHSVCTRWFAFAGGGVGGGWDASDATHLDRDTLGRALGPAAGRERWRREACGEAGAGADMGWRRRRRRRRRSGRGASGFTVFGIFFRGWGERRRRAAAVEKRGDFLLW